MRNQLFFACGDNVTSFVSQKYVETSQILNYQRFWPPQSYFYNRIKIYFAKHVIFRIDTLLRKGLFSPFNKVFLFGSQNYVETQHDIIYPKILVTSSFTIHIKSISQSSNFRTITILRNGLFTPAVTLKPFSCHAIGLVIY